MDRGGYYSPEADQIPFVFWVWQAVSSLKGIGYALENNPSCRRPDLQAAQQALLTTLRNYVFGEDYWVS